MLRLPESGIAGWGKVAAKFILAQGSPRAARA
ncbi:unnamed protein product, partial [marine sediment metagenome]